MRLLLAVLFCSTLALAESQIAYKAQHGWGLPRQIATPSITQGVVLDTNRLIIAEMAGLETRDLNGQNPKLLLEQSGIRGLLGVGSGQNLALAWYRRDVTSANGVWWWHKGLAQLAFETPYADFSLLEYQGQPLLIAVQAQGASTALVLQRWGQTPKTVFKTKLNIGALAANTVANKIGIALAEGYRNPQDEKYDLRFLQISKLELEQSKLLSPAVYLGREQRFGVALRGNNFLPIWWYETKKEQSFAAFTKQHNPRLALYENGQVVEFAPAATYLGQLGGAVYYSLKNQIISYDLESKTTRVEITTPESFAFASLSSQRLVAWQSLGRDGFSSQLWLADSGQPFEPTLVDQISRTLGWNPWFPVQNFLGQTALSLMLAGLAVLVVAPFVWLLRGRFDFGQGIWFGIGCAVFSLLLLRIFGGSVVAPTWIFMPLLTAPWLIVLLGIGLGSLLVYWQRKRLNGIELGATIAASLVVLVSTFITVFSRVGFLQF